MKGIILICLFMFCMLAVVVATATPNNLAIVNTSNWYYPMAIATAFLIAPLLVPNYSREFLTNKIKISRTVL